MPIHSLMSWTSTCAGSGRAEGSVAPINTPGVHHGESQGIRYPYSIAEGSVTSSNPPGISMDSHSAVRILMEDIW